MSVEQLAGWARFPQLDVLGSGTFGTVYLSRDLLTTSDYYNELVAVKSVALQRISDAEVKLAMTEVAILRELDHPNVLKFIDCFIDDDQLLCCVTEYVNGGDLSVLIKEAKRANRFLDSFVVVDMARQLLEGLAYLHSQAVLHRDIKPANLYLTSSGAVKIGDFGVSKLMSDVGSSAEAVTFIGTPYYICPELARGEPYSFGADVWALGVVLFELHTLRLPFFARNIMALMAIIGNGQYDIRAVEQRVVSAEQREGLLSSCGPEYVMKSESLASLVASLVKSMLVVDKGSRMSAQELLSTFFGVSSAPADELGLEYDVRASRANSIMEQDAQVFNASVRQSLRASSISCTASALASAAVKASDAFADADAVVTADDHETDDDDDHHHHRGGIVAPAEEEQYADDFEPDDSDPSLHQTKNGNRPGDNDEEEEEESSRRRKVVVKITPNHHHIAGSNAIGQDFSSPEGATSSCVQIVARAVSPPRLLHRPSGTSSDLAAANVVRPPNSVFRDPHAVEKLLREKALKYHERRLAMEKKARARAEQQQQKQQASLSFASAPDVEGRTTSQEDQQQQERAPNFAIAFGSAVPGGANVHLGQSALAAKNFATSLLFSSSKRSTSSSSMRRTGGRKRRGDQGDSSDDEEDEEDDEDGEGSSRKPISTALVLNASGETVPLRRISSATSFKMLVRRVSAVVRSRNLLPPTAADPAPPPNDTSDENTSGKIMREKKRKAVEEAAEALKLTYLDPQGDVVQLGTRAEWRYVLMAVTEAPPAGNHRSLLLRCGL